MGMGEGPVGRMHPIDGAVINMFFSSRAFSLGWL